MLSKNVAPIAVVGRTFGAFAAAAKMFLILTDLINNMTILLGSELAQTRAVMTDAHLTRSIITPPTPAEPAVWLMVGGCKPERSVVAVDDKLPDRVTGHEDQPSR